MSIKSIFKYFIFVLVGTCIGLGYFHFEKQSNIDSEKWRKLTSKPAPSQWAMRKATGVFQVDITVKNNEEIVDGDILELVGTITPTQDIASAKLTWVLFKGFEIVRGSETEILNNLKSGEAIEVAISLRKIGDDDSVIHLSIDSNIQGTTFGGEASFSTKANLGEAAQESAMKLQQNNFLKSEGFKKGILQ